MCKPTKPELLAQEIARLMSDNRHWTVIAVARSLNVTEARVRLAMKKILNACVVYHSQRIGPSRRNAYRLISAALTMSSDLDVAQVGNDDARREAELDQRHRRLASSWPAGDDVLIKAMHAMVKARQTVPTDN